MIAACRQLHGHGESEAILNLREQQRSNGKMEEVLVQGRFVWDDRYCPS